MARTPVKTDTAAAWGSALSGNPAAARELFDEASLLHVPGDSGLAGQYQGGEAILGLLNRMARLTRGTLRYAPNRVLRSTDHTIILGRLRATCRDFRFETDTVHVLSLGRGKVSEVWMFHEHQDLVDRFWAMLR